MKLEEYTYQDIVLLSGASTATIASAVKKAKGGSGILLEYCRQLSDIGIDDEVIRQKFQEMSDHMRVLSELFDPFESRGFSFYELWAFLASMKTQREFDAVCSILLYGKNDLTVIRRGMMSAGVLCSNCIHRKRQVKKIDMGANEHKEKP